MLIETERLILRHFREDDREAFAALNQDPEVMRFFPKLLSRQESDAVIKRIEDHFVAHGFGLYAVEVKQGAPMIGFVGLFKPAFSAPFVPCVEVGWRLARSHWGHGYATEAAQACVRLGFENLGLDEIVSFTVPDNLRSRAVMERLGFTRDLHGDFEHPAIPEGHPRRLHVLYRLTRAQFETQTEET